MKKSKAKKSAGAVKKAPKGTPMSMDNVLWQLVNRPKMPPKKSAANRSAKAKDES